MGPRAAHTRIAVSDHRRNQNGFPARAAPARKWFCRTGSPVSRRLAGSASAAENPSDAASDSRADIFQ